MHEKTERHSQQRNEALKPKKKKKYKKQQAITVQPCDAHCCFVVRARSLLQEMRVKLQFILKEHGHKMLAAAASSTWGERENE